MNDKLVPGVGRAVFFSLGEQCGLSTIDLCYGALCIFVLCKWLEAKRLALVLSFLSFISVLSSVSG